MSAASRPDLTDEQIEISRTFEDFLAGHSSEEAVRASMETERGFDDRVWAQLAELGIPGLAVTEEYGGVGLGVTELSLVLEAAGASLLCAPLFSSTVLATTLVTEAGRDDAKERLLPDLASGERRAALVLGEFDSTGTGVRPTVKAEATASGWTLAGRAFFVIDGHTADELVVVAEVPGGIGVFAVEGTAPGVSRAPMQTLDLTRKQASISFSGVSANRIDGDSGAEAAVGRTLDIARVLLAAEQVGGAERCLATAVEYAKTRVQFDRPIGSFQAIKHKCANMLIAVESARVTMIEAVRSASARSEALAHDASLAKAVCSESYFRVASDALHVHGGIGFTWEHPSHLYFRRAKADELMFGSPAQHRERLLELAGLAGGEARKESAA